MYESFYGFSAKPFQLNPDPSFYYGSKEHRRAMAYLEYGLHKSEGFIVVTGEVGAGKTTVVRNLLNKLDSNKVVAAQLVTTHLNAEDTLRMVGASFGLPLHDMTKSEMLLSIEAFLVKLSLQGKRGLLVVDEAQNLTPHAMEELRMLSNYQLENHGLLQSFLVGQPEFRRMLESPEMLQLRQRVVAGCHISPMDQDETRGYVEHRLNHVGWKADPAFEPQAFEVLFEVTDGIPRRINAICDRLLLSGYLAGKHEITAADVSAAGLELREETQGASATAPEAASGANGAGRHDDFQTLGFRGDEIDLENFRLDPALADKASLLMAGLQASEVEARLERLERNYAATTSILRQLLDAARGRPSTDRN